LIDVQLFLDIHSRQLTKTGEELCGDGVRVRRTNERTVLVLSDGLGSGVKANILSTMTAEILVTMLSENISLKDVLDTVIGTLPVCQVRLLAYATFSVIVVDNQTLDYMVANFDNPPPIHLNNGRLNQPEYSQQLVRDKTIDIYKGRFNQGDFIALLSDGVPHAGLGTSMDFGWGWDKVAKSVAHHAMLSGPVSRGIVEGLMTEVAGHYRNRIGDDASCAGMLVRPKSTMILFTGPPINEADDGRIVERVLAFPGYKVVCGGTTGNIVGRHMGMLAEVDITTMTPDIPPIAELPGIDLVTEGILTMNKALEVLESCHAVRSGLPTDRNGAVLLARAIIDADEIQMIVGQQINEYYQNPLLPREVSLRKGLIDRYVELLERLNKRVRVEYC
jgi:Stage II sporulation protein E (SpoIIE)